LSNTIFQCGRPVDFDTCRQCGLRIGGQRYVIAQGNLMLVK